VTELHIEQIGLLATVQDLGRLGYAHLGVPPAGAADRRSLRNANRLVGNDDNAAAIEIAVRGLTCTTSLDVDVAVIGASWSIDNVDVSNASAHVTAGATVRVANPEGVYAYLAVSGGIEVEAVLGSRSTDTVSGLGPAPLRRDAVLPIGPQHGVRRDPVPASPEGALHVVIGPHVGWFADNAIDILLANTWTVSPSSNRTGLRLAGPALSRRTTDELPSEGMVAGAIQVPTDGQPIVLLANHPTTGGYPVIAVVRSDDVDRVAQHRPGSTVRFSSQGMRR
jgi:biotin-dependent carboxylase-like uncharacterized protein